MRPSPLALPALSIAALLALSWIIPASADVVTMPQTTAPNTADSPPPSLLPQRGQTMAQVRKALGPPLKTHPTVGGHAPRRPPITRWDYPTFSVVFERNKVIDAVVPGDPPKIYHTRQLQR